MRAGNNWTKQVSDAQLDVEELKDKQIFGGDSLNMQRWRGDISIPTSQTNYYLWQVLLTPEDAKYTMPIAFDVTRKTDNDYGSFLVEPVRRTDGRFEWWVITEPSYDTKTNTVVAVLEYTGKGTVTLTRLA